MGTEKSTQDSPDRRANGEDVKRAVGDADDIVVAEILSVRPTLKDLTDAALWARGDGDLLAREHMELSAAAVAVAEILTREEEQQSLEGEQA